jgi:hypothetical protein
MFWTGVTDLGSIIEPFQINMEKGWMIGDQLTSFLMNPVYSPGGIEG